LPKKSEVPETTNNEMLCSHRADRSVVDVNEWKTGVLQHPKHIHDGNSRPAECGGHVRGQDTRDDAVALPALEPARQLLIDTVRLVKQQPWLVVA